MDFEMNFVLEREIKNLNLDFSNKIQEAKGLGSLLK